MDKKWVGYGDFRAGDPTQPKKKEYIYIYIYVRTKLEMDPNWVGFSPNNEFIESR